MCALQVKGPESTTTKNTLIRKNRPEKQETATHKFKKEKQKNHCLRGEPTPREYTPPTRDFSETRGQGGHLVFRKGSGRGEKKR